MKRIINLFVIDDDKIYHFLFKNLLKQNDIHVRATYFTNGADAVEFIRNCSEEDQPDLILLDINMPIMNGWQFLEEYNKLKGIIKNDCIVYMISSSNNDVDIERSKSFDGVVKDYFLKPICKEDLDKIFLTQI